MSFYHLDKPNVASIQIVELMKTKWFTLVLTSFFAWNTLAGTALVDSKVIYDTPAPVSDWEVRTEIYGWMANLGGDLTVRGESHDFGYGFGDIVQELDMAGFVSAKIRYKRFSLLTDVMYLKLSPTANPQFPPFLSSNLGIQMVIAHGVGLYRIWEGEHAFLDVGAGVRYVYNRTKSTTSGPLIPARFRASTLHSLNGIAAVNGSIAISPKFYIGFYADIGAGDAELTWQALGSLNYNLFENIDASLGFRWLQFRSGDGDLNVAMYGPYAGVVIRW